MFSKRENVLGGKTLEAYACQVVFVLKGKRFTKRFYLEKGKCFRKTKLFGNTMYRMNNLMSLGKKDLAQVRCE